jgi:hypothetical protein
VSGIFSDSRSAYIVSFFSDFMSVFYKWHSVGRHFLTLCLQILCHFFLTLCRCFKNDITSADFRSVWKNDLMSVVVLKSDLMSGRQCVIFYWLYVGIEKWHNVSPTLCHFFCSKFDRRRVIFSDFMSVIEKRFYVDPTLCHFLSDFMSVIEKRLYVGPTMCHFGFL